LQVALGNATNDRVGAYGMISFGFLDY
jgi:hypothetical protein